MINTLQTNIKVVGRIELPLTEKKRDFSLFPDNYASGFTSPYDDDFGEDSVKWPCLNSWK